MFSKANIVSTIVTAIWGMAGGYLLWGVLGDPLLADYMDSATGVMKDPPDFVHLSIGCLVQGFAFSVIYSKWGQGNYGSGGGINYGIWMGILAGLGAGLINFATSNILDITGTFINAGIYLVFFAVMGLLAGLVYNKMA